MTDSPSTAERPVLTPTRRGPDLTLLGLSAALLVTLIGYWRIFLFLRDGHANPYLTFAVSLLGTSQGPTSASAALCCAVRTRSASLGLPLPLLPSSVSLLSFSMRHAPIGVMGFCPPPAPFIGRLPGL